MLFTATTASSGIDPGNGAAAAMVVRTMRGAWKFVRLESGDGLVNSKKLLRALITGAYFFRDASAAVALTVAGCV
jgi:hypothetical protein